MTTPTPPPRPLATPTPAPTADPARIAALVAEGERALDEGKPTEADERFGLVLALAPAEARGRVGKARVATTRLGLARTFVPDLPSSEAEEGRVESVPGFKDLEGMNVRKAVKVPGRAELEAAPERVKPGDSYTVRVYLRNQDTKKKQKLRIVHVKARNTVNGQDSAVEVSWKPLEVKHRERPLIASLSGRWGGQRDVVVARGEGVRRGRWSTRTAWSGSDEHPRWLADYASEPRFGSQGMKALVSAA